MKQKPPMPLKEHPELANIVQAVGSGRYFRYLMPEILLNILKQGLLLTLEKDSYLIREGDKQSSEMYILVRGSLAVTSRDKFILRLNQPGDVVGEMAAIQATLRSTDVVAETDCSLISFPGELFLVEPHSSQASVLYVLFAHILVEKLRITTAQSMIQKNQRNIFHCDIKIGIVDPDAASRAMIRAAIKIEWPKANIVEFDDLFSLRNGLDVERFNLIVADIDSLSGTKNSWGPIGTCIKAIQLCSEHLIIFSAACHDPDVREFLIQLEVDDLLSKPCAQFDLNHIVGRVQTWHYKNMELDRAESEAETDRLTGLANRRRLDEFLNALLTVHADDEKPFSLILTDIDSFKYYNDTNGHQMGDVVLRDTAALLMQNVRRGDLAARYGGEEFVVILPDCGKVRALELAERIRLAVASTCFPHEESQPGKNLTLTIGVATFPDDATDLHTLLKKADDCLYEGKRGGKNIVVAAQPLDSI